MFELNIEVNMLEEITDSMLEIFPHLPANTMLQDTYYFVIVLHPQD